MWQVLNAQFAKPPHLKVIVKLPLCGASGRVQPRMANSPARSATSIIARHGSLPSSKGGWNSSQKGHDTAAS